MFVVSYELAAAATRVTTLDYLQNMWAEAPSQQRRDALTSIQLAGRGGRLQLREGGH